jgi:hypothetical protein
MGVMDSDDSMDIESLIQQVMEVVLGISQEEMLAVVALHDEFGPESAEFLKARMVAHEGIVAKMNDPVVQFRVMFDVMTAASNELGVEGGECLQVIGAVFMAMGIAIVPDIMCRIVEAARNDAWAKTEPARKAAMDAFIAILGSYDGKTQTHVASTGLFDAIASTLGEMRTTH